MSLYIYRELKRSKPEDFYDASFITELDKRGCIDSLYRTRKAPGNGRHDSGGQTPLL